MASAYTADSTPSWPHWIQPIHHFIADYVRTFHQLLTTALGYQYRRAGHAHECLCSESAPRFCRRASQTPKKPGISDYTWMLRGLRQQQRKQLRELHLQLKKHTIAKAFLGWARADSSQRQDYSSYTTSLLCGRVRLVCELTLTSCKLRRHFQQDKGARLDGSATAATSMARQSPALSATTSSAFSSRQTFPAFLTWNILIDAPSPTRLLVMTEFLLNYATHAQPLWQG